MLLTILISTILQRCLAGIPLAWWADQDGNGKAHAHAPSCEIETGGGRQCQAYSGAQTISQEACAHVSAKPSGVPFKVAESNPRRLVVNGNATANPGT